MNKNPNLRNFLLANKVYFFCIKAMHDFPLNNVIHYQVHKMFRAVLLDDNEPVKNDPAFQALGEFVTRVVKPYIGSPETVAPEKSYISFMKLIFEDWYHPNVGKIHKQMLKTKDQSKYDLSDAYYEKSPFLYYSVVPNNQS